MTGTRLRLMYLLYRGHPRRKRLPREPPLGQRHRWIAVSARRRFRVVSQR
nr:hypothetical protein [Halorientalis litorea]